MTSLVDNARQRLLSKGITLPPKPKEDEPSLPVDITMLNERDLMSLYSRFVSWTNYVGVQLAIADIEERAAESTFEVVKGVVFHDVITGGMEKRSTVVAKTVMTAPEVAKARDELDEAMAYRKLTQSGYNTSERCMQALSREITRRVNTEVHNRRDHKWGGA